MDTAVALPGLLPVVCGCTVGLLLTLPALASAAIRGSLRGVIRVAALALALLTVVTVTGAALHEQLLG